MREKGLGGRRTGPARGDADGAVVAVIRTLFREALDVRRPVVLVAEHVPVLALRD